MIIFFYLILLFITLLSLLFVVLNLGPYLFGAPYSPSSDNRAKTILKLLKPKKGERIADLGSGDGKLLLMIAQKGAYAVGYEINPVLVWKSKRKIKKLGLDKNIKVYWQDFRKKNLSEFDAITVYGITYMMARLEKKLLNELKPGTHVVSNFYRFPNWKPAKKEANVYLYIK